MSGDLSKPTGFQNVIGGTFDARRNQATNFQAFNGQAPYGGMDFANELGNRLTYGLHLTSETTFQLKNLEDGFSSTLDPSLGFDYALSSYAGSTFSSRRVGIYYGADGVKGGGDDVRYDTSLSGDDSTLINEINLVSGGIADEVLASATGATNQDKMNIEAANLGGYSLTANYRLNGGTVHSGTVNLTAAPAPSALLTFGISALAARRRRKKSA